MVTFYQRFFRNREARLSIALLAILVLLSLIPRLAGLTRDTWQDEVRHIYSAVSAITVRDVLRNVADQLQPALEYLLRKFFWQPLVGQEEREARLVSVFYGILAVVFVFLALIKYMRIRGLPTIVSLFLAMLIALNLGLAPTAVNYSIEGRHYSFIEMLSVIWFASYLLFGRFSTKMFYFLSLAFACSYFFSLFLIAFVAAYELVCALIQKQGWLKYAYPVFYGASILVITAAINKYSFAYLLSSSGTVNRPLSEVLPEGFGYYLRFWREDTASLWIGALTLVFLPLCLRKKNESLLRASFFTVPVFLFFLWYVRLKNSYPTYERYLLFFWGCVPALVAILAADIWHLSIWKKISGKLIPYWLGPTVFCLLFLPVLDISRIAQLPKQARAISLPKRNFTDFYLLHDRMKKERVPIFILFAEPFTYQIPYFYMRNVNPPFEFGFQAYDTMGGNGISLAKVRERLKEWIQSNPHGVIFLDPRKDCNDKRTAAAELLHEGRRCMWRVVNPGSLNSVLREMQAVGFPAHNDFYTEVPAFGKQRVVL